MAQHREFMHESPQYVASVLGGTAEQWAHDPCPECEQQEAERTADGAVSAAEADRGDEALPGDVEAAWAAATTRCSTSSSGTAAISARIRSSSGTAAAAAAQSPRQSRPPAAPNAGGAL